MYLQLTEHEDLYYSLEDAQNGLISYEELIRHARAQDMEEGDNIPPGFDEEKGTYFYIVDYQATDFLQFTNTGSVTETYRVIDSAGNTYGQMITVHVIDTSAKDILPFGTTRFLSEKYYYETFENGGLKTDSIWKVDVEYINTLQRVFENSRNNNPVLRFYLKQEEILKMKAYIQDNGFGKTKNEIALQRFYDEFLRNSTY